MVPAAELQPARLRPTAADVEVADRHAAARLPAARGATKRAAAKPKPSALRRKFGRNMPAVQRAGDAEDEEEEEL